MSPTKANLRTSDHEGPNKKNLKRKHEGEDDTPSRPAPATPGRIEECDEAEGTSPEVAPIKTVIESITQDEASSTVPALAELAAKKIIDTLLQSDDPIHEIASIEPHVQSLLTPYIWKEYTRLRSYHHDHKHSGEWHFPPADRALFMHDGSRIPCPDPGEVNNKPDSQGRENGYILRQRFITQWKYSNDNYEDKRVIIGERVSWGGSELYREDKTGLQSCRCGSPKDRREWGGYKCKQHTPEKRCALWDCISSPLLYYRLTAVFGMPPANIIDQYKACWSVTLGWIGNEGGSIYLSEHKGSATASFGGSLEASESALKLLDWLVSDNVPHAYEGVLAGSVMKTASKKAVFRNVKPLDDTIIVDQQDQLCSSEFWQKYRQLRDFEDEHKPSCNAHYFPYADRVLSTHDGSRIPNPDYSDSDDKDSYYAGRENGRDIKKAFLKQWGFDLDSYQGRSYIWQLKYERRQNGHHDSVSSEEKSISWDSDGLYRDDQTSQFQICDCDESLDQASDCREHPPDRHRPFHQYISSQLLYYRLTAIFEMPPDVETDENESCWEATLYNYDDEGSCLIFGEHKGCAKVSFKGSSQASESALKLLDWLVGDNIPHNYDGILAGTCA